MAAYSLAATLPNCTLFLLSKLLETAVSKQGPALLDTTHM